MLKISPVEKVKGSITVPGDKSISHRAIMLTSVSQGKSIIEGFLRSEDCLSTVHCFKQLGIEIEEVGQRMIVHGKGNRGLKEPHNVLDAGNSGTTMRLISGILAGQDFMSIISGDESLRRRPMGRIIGPLKAMGAIIDGRKAGTLAPIVIRGNQLRGIDYTLPVPSAQVKSAVLLAGLYGGEATVVREVIPSRDHTEKMMKILGANIKTEANGIILEPSQLYGERIVVPGDISSAAFFMVAAAALPGSELVIRDVGVNSTRTGIIEVLRDMGAQIEVETALEENGEPIGSIRIKGRKLVGTTITKERIPKLIDEIPIIAVAAALAEGKTRITGAEELKVKESNRIDATVKELQKLGVQIHALEDGIEVFGPNKITGGRVQSHGDHRIAMALAICGIFATETVSIQDSDCINISFPGFERILKDITL